MLSRLINHVSARHLICFGLVCIASMVLSLYAKQRIIQHYFEGTKLSTRIKKYLEADRIHVSRVTVWKFIRNYRETRCIARREGSGHPTKITTQIKKFVEAQMQQDDERRPTSSIKF